MELIDPAVEKAMLEALGCDNCEDVQLMQTLDELTLQGAKQLKDLLSFPNLRSLIIADSEIKDAEVLTQLPALRSLTLIQVKGVCSAHVAPLTRLKKLWISGCGSWDARSLAGLTKLQELTLIYAEIEDISPLRGMTRMQSLSISNDKVPLKNASSLVAMKRLRRLELDTKQLQDRSMFANKWLRDAYAACGDFPEPADPAASHSAMRRPKLQYLAAVHPRMYFCHDAALVQLSSGLGKLACRDYGKGKIKEVYDLYLGDTPLVKTCIPNCGTCSTYLEAGYGDGLCREESYLAVRDKLNASYDGLCAAIENIAPLVGLLESGLYLIADCTLFPACRNKGKDAATHKEVDTCDYFWDCPRYDDGQLHVEHYVWFSIDPASAYPSPVFLAPSQRAAQMDPQQVDAHVQRLKDEHDHFPRAVALYLSGAVALLLDGHHKAAACAIAGVPVRTLVIFPVKKTPALMAACEDKTRLYWNQLENRISALCDGKGEKLAQVLSLQDMQMRRIFAPDILPVDWGRIPDEYRPHDLARYPYEYDLAYGMRIPQNQLRAHIETQMQLPKGERDRDILKRLQDHVHLFPDSKWLTASEREWLMEGSWRQG